MRRTCWNAESLRILHSRTLSSSRKITVERQRRMDAGDETAQLKFTKPSPPPPKQGQRPQAPSYPPSGSRAGSPGSYGAPRYPSYGAGGGGAQKRPYTPTPAAYNPNKAPRTQSYHGSHGGYRR